MQRETGKEEKSEIQWWWKTFKIGGVLSTQNHCSAPSYSQSPYMYNTDYEEAQVRWKGLTTSLQMFRGISRSYDARGWAALDLLPNTNVKWFCVTLLLFLPGLCSSIGSGTKRSLVRAFSQATRTASFAQS